jgi:Tol biopolymer transport system component
MSILLVSSVVYVTLDAANITLPAANAAFPGIDGKIVFGSERGGFGSELYIANPDGSDLLRLTDSIGDDLNPSFSPDGTRIAFMSIRDHLSDDFTTEIYVMDTNGNNVRRLTFDNQSDFNPTWSPDGRYIAFNGFCSTIEQPSICLIDSDGNSDPIPFPGTLPGDILPSWSPDGTRIAFGHIQAINNNPGTPIFVMNSDGTNRTQLTDPGFQVYDQYPDWSPDSSKIVFSRETSGKGDGEIIVMDSNGDNEINLTNTPVDHDRDPVFSPDGTKIAFTGPWVCGPKDCGPDIMMINVDGSNLTSLGLNDQNEDYEPSWGPAVATGIIADATNQATGQSMFAGGRTFYGEQFSPNAAIINKVVDCATVELRRHDLPTGNAEIGFYDSNMNLVKLFGTKNVSTLTTGYKAYEFCLPDSDNAHQIQENQILAVKYDGGDSINRIDVRRSNIGAGPDYDGLASYHVNFDTIWHRYDSSTNSRDLLFKLTNN